jgi:UDP-2,4-diacetamido-2,4,6-trideoxy-beta-L-altropyranose hydrolase
VTPVAVIRADGSRQLGHGHVFRTLTLAAELANRGWQVHYVCRDLGGAPLPRIRGAGFGLELLPPGIDETSDAEAVVRVSAQTGASWVVVDRYATDDSAYRLWREQGLKVLAIDDICEHPFPVEILLNQNAGAVDLHYEVSDDTVRLLGPRYALVRDAYRQARPAAPRTIDEVRRVMVFMGGTDPDDATGRVLAAIEAVGRCLEVEVIVGSGYPHVDRLQGAARSSRHHVEVHRDVPDLVEPMSRADIAISAGGSVTWELCCMGVPMVLAPIASNQLGIAEAMVRVGAAIGIDAEPGTTSIRTFFDNPSGVATAARIAHGLVDGDGIIRVVEAMEEKAHKARENAAQLISVRTASCQDARFLWELANDRDVRVNSFNSQPIPWEHHVKWLGARLDDPSTVLLVALDEESNPCGQIRFDVQESKAELNYSLARWARGRGLGTALIEAGLGFLFGCTSVELVTALVKVENIASLVTFERTGWVREEDVVVRGSRSARFTRVRGVAEG